ncbi:MAG: HAD family acid phosphatase [Ignavibacterium sp.]|nr:HAD family acid phosphatase [Ignavibacterium sp.]
MKSILITSLLFLIIINSCCNQELVNLRTAKDKVKEYYESGKYENELNEIYSAVKSQVEKLDIKNNSVAIFDVDDTALSNYEISKRLDFGYEHQIIQDWVLSAKLPAIKPTLEFYNYLKSKKVRLIFLTGRYFEEYDATLKNLINEGYIGFDTLIVRNESEKKLSAEEYKLTKRKELESSGYEIIVCVGDQFSDLSGKHTGIKVKLPNYLYEIK